VCMSECISNVAIISLAVRSCCHNIAICKTMFMPTLSCLRGRSSLQVEPDLCLIKEVERLGFRRHYISKVRGGRVIDRIVGMPYISIFLLISSPFAVCWPQ
jgi:hypothetical protein